MAVKAMPKSRRPGLMGLAPDVDGWRLRIGVTAAPEGGRANDAVCATLATALGVSQNAVSVIHGASSRQKLLRVTGDPALLGAKLALISSEFSESPT